jgi:signal transduction histidine kinase
MSVMGWVLSGTRQVLRRRAFAVDGVVAVALTVGAVWAVTTLRHDSTIAITLVSAVLCTGAVAWRRFAPLPAALVALTAVAAYQISGHDTQGAFVTAAIVLTCYLVGRATTSRWQLGTAAGYALAAITVVEIDDRFSIGGDLLTWIPLAVVPIAAGVFVARREALARELADARAGMRGERDLAKERAVAEERTRVARELHDVVSHCVSVMVIQAGAARLLARSDLTAARGAMRVVATSGRDALADLRRVVGVRRHDSDEMDTATLGLAQVPQLVERAREAGSVVQLHLDVGATLRADLDLAAFRIVQEALTNVRKHAPAAAVTIAVSVAADEVQLDVEDTGPARTAQVPGSGHGLVGMRERAALHGGVVDAGPRPVGGFAVHARLPLAAPSISTAACAGTVTVAPRQRGLLWRNWPLLLVVVAGALAFVVAAGTSSSNRASAVAGPALFVSAFALAAYSSLRIAVAGLGVLIAGSIVVVTAQHQAAGVAFGASLAAGVVWVGGRVVRDQRELVTQLRTATAALAAERDALAIVALEEERIRIARDLHTIVARLVTTMVVQAEAVDELLGTDPIAAVDAVPAIERTGRAALVQLRQMLGVLRHRFDPAPREPSLDSWQRPATPDAVAAVPS